MPRLEEALCKNLEKLSQDNYAKICNALTLDLDNPVVMDKLLASGTAKAVEWLEADSIEDVQDLVYIAAAVHSRSHAISVPANFTDLMELAVLKRA